MGLSKLGELVGELLERILIDWGVDLGPCSKIRIEIKRRDKLADLKLNAAVHSIARGELSKPRWNGICIGFVTLEDGGYWVVVGAPIVKREGLQIPVEGFLRLWVSLCGIDRREVKGLAIERGARSYVMAEFQRNAVRATRLRYNNGARRLQVRSALGRVR